jgi:NitT/TauT family transport system permease protein
MTSSAPQAGIAVPTRKRKPAWRRRLADVLWPLAAIGVVILIWQLYSTLFDVQLYVLAPPWESFKSAITNAGAIYPEALITIKEALIGLVIAILLGIPLALLIDASETLERLVYPILVSSQVIPLVAIAPILVLTLGFGTTPKIVIVVIFATFPIILESLVGLRSLAIEKIYLSRSVGASGRDFFLKIKLPNALPHVLTGVKLAGTLAVIGAVVAEFIAASEGLGHYVLAANANQDTTTMLGGIIWLAGIGIIMFLLLDILERLLIPWHVSHRHEQGSGGAE